MKFILTMSHSKHHNSSSFHNIDLKSLLGQDTQHLEGINKLGILEVEWMKAR